MIFFFFSSRRRHTRCLSDWSSDVCSSDLEIVDVEIRRHSKTNGLATPRMNPKRPLGTTTVRDPTLTSALSGFSDLIPGYCVLSWLRQIGIQVEGAEAGSRACSLSRQRPLSRPGY